MSDPLEFLRHDIKSLRTSLALEPFNDHLKDRGRVAQGSVVDDVGDLDLPHSCNKRATPTLQTFANTGSGFRRLMIVNGVFADTVGQTNPCFEKANAECPKLGDSDEVEMLLP